MMPVHLDREARKATIERILPYLGKAVPAKFIQKTGETLRGLDRLHNLIEGIYKPGGSQYALSIASMLKNPYADRVEYNDDRSWFFDYSPKVGPLDSAVNASLFSCMRDNEPVLVLKQLSDKTGPNGTRYRLLGLGLLEGYEDNSRLFRIRGMQFDEIQAYLGNANVLEDELIDTAIQLEALEAWSPFVDQNRSLYQVNAQKRNQHFRRIVLDNYNSACAITGQRFCLNDLVEAEAAHIIAKEHQGTDDPRNGLSMSRSVHWAFDKGIFSISDQYEVLIHPKAKEGDIQNFPLFELDRRTIILPEEEYYHPHPDALQWHRDEVYGKFAG